MEFISSVLLRTSAGILLNDKTGYFMDFPALSLVIVALLGVGTGPANKSNLENVTIFSELAL